MCRPVPYHAIPWSSTTPPLSPVSRITICAEKRLQFGLASKYLGLICWQSCASGNCLSIRPTCFGIVHTGLLSNEILGGSVGTKLSDSKVLDADLVMVAAGAWSGSLVDLRGRTEATGHAVVYMDITAEEQKALDDFPVVLNLSTGLFIIPPRDQVLKVARHTFGYINPVKITNALPPSPNDKREPFIASQPYTSRNDRANILSIEASNDLRRALTDILPIRGLENRPWKLARICWYSDTRDGEWLIDYHPGWKGLFVATGDSGHGFKFLPNLGEKILDVIQGQGGKLGAKWRWKEMEKDDVGRETNGVYKGLITQDGSRGGRPLVLADELAKGRADIGEPKAKL